MNRKATMPEVGSERDGQLKQPSVTGCVSPHFKRPNSASPERNDAAVTALQLIIELQVWIEMES